MAATSVQIPKGSTLAMCSYERTWMGVRLEAFVKNGAECRHYPLAVMRGDAPQVVGRDTASGIRNLHIFDPLISRAHLLVWLPVSAETYANGTVLHVSAIGYRGFLIGLKEHELVNSGETRLVPLDTELELVPGTNVWYRVTYL